MTGRPRGSACSPPPKTHDGHCEDHPGLCPPTSTGGLLPKRHEPIKRRNTGLSYTDSTLLLGTTAGGMQSPPGQRLPPPPRLRQ